MSVFSLYSQRILSEPELTADDSFLSASDTVPPPLASVVSGDTTATRAGVLWVTCSFSPVALKIFFFRFIFVWVNSEFRVSPLWGFPSAYSFYGFTAFARFGDFSVLASSRALSALLWSLRLGLSGGDRWIFGRRPTGPRGPVRSGFVSCFLCAVQVGSVLSLRPRVSGPCAL